MTRNLTRLHVNQNLESGFSVVFDRQQTHYLRDVMRLEDGSSLLIFNGRDGEWRVDNLSLKQKEAQGKIAIKTREQPALKGPVIYFAPVKKNGTDFIVTKGTELGARSLNPVITDFTTSIRVNQRRLESNAREAAEQSGRLDIPTICALTTLKHVLDTWTGDKPLVVADETNKGPPALRALYEIEIENVAPAFLVGPQGGFSKTELVFLRSLPFVITVGLGPRILRSETAVAAILTCWQAARGDWT